MQTFHDYTFKPGEEVVFRMGLRMYKPERYGKKVFKITKVADVPEEQREAVGHHQVVTLEGFDYIGDGVAGCNVEPF